MPEVRKEKLRRKNIYLLGTHHFKDILKLLKKISENSYEEKEFLSEKNEIKLCLPKIPEIKKIGIKNTYFPLFIPEKTFAKLAKHTQDFAPEVAAQAAPAGGASMQVARSSCNRDCSVPASASSNANVSSSM